MQLFDIVHVSNLLAIKKHIDGIMKDYHNKVYAKVALLSFLILCLGETDYNLSKLIHVK